MAVAEPRTESVCCDLKRLRPAARRQRELDHYTERSPDPRATCSACQFFAAAAQPTDCGTCQLFKGPANRNGRCDDWTVAEPA